MSARLLYEIADAGIQLSVSARTVERLVKDGEIASVKIGRRRLVPHDALEDYIDRLRRAA
jgi:excisionase family DNA binding protein